MHQPRSSFSLVFPDEKKQDRLIPRTDNELMLEVRDGDVEKLGTLFERYGTKLYNFFVRYTGRRDASEDLVQDVFFRILKYRHTYRGEAPFTVWMYQLARNASADYFRRWKPDMTTSEDEDSHESKDPTPSELVEQSDEHALLRKALARLTEEKREVLVLSRLQGMKYDEIGRVLECPVGTVKARVHYALKDLREEYLKLTKEVP